MNELQERISPRNFETGPNLPLDWVETCHLPSVEYIRPSGDGTNVLSWLDKVTHGSSHQFAPRTEIEKLKPSSIVYSMDNVGIDFELLASDARSQAADKLRYIIRMGGSFDLERADKTPREFEALAVETMGLDASLYFHGVEQARRMNSLMVLQQEVRQQMFVDIILEHGPTQKAVAVLRKMSDVMPGFKPKDVKQGVLCGLIHDYGEAKLGKDVPIEFKTDPEYVAFEAGACVDYATELHFPSGSQRLSAALQRRVDREASDVDFDDPEHEEIALYLHPVEITNAIFGTEQLHHGEIARGDAFAAVERQEYVLSGIRAFEAVEHNFQGTANNLVLTQNLLRLGVSTFFRSLRQLMVYGEKYVYIYDFLRQNAGTINRYMDIVSTDIRVRAGEQDGETVPDYFGVDPFQNYPEGEESDTISRNEAKERFLSTVEAWKDWQDKDHLVKRVWETYVGTTHALTEDNPDVSFLQQTARNVVESDSGSTPVYKHLIDMWGIALDTESQALHEEKAALSVS